MPSLSIIIPVYNVEIFIKRCIDSVLAQSFKKFELILVDDGSTDMSGDICEEYSRSDKRIKVIHKENGGSSSARNAGLRIANGKYIGFVDSDDYIEYTMYENLMEPIEKDSSIDICIGSYVAENKDGIVRKAFRMQQEQRFSGHEALLHMFQYKIFDWALWDKIYKKELFDGITCAQEIEYGDDTATNWILFNKAITVYYKPIHQYHYCMRLGSLMHDEFSMKKLMYLDVLMNINEEISDTQVSLKKCIQKLLFRFIRIYILQMLRSKDRSYKERVQYYQEIIRNDYAKNFGTLALNQKNKALLEIFSLPYEEIEKCTQKEYDKFVAALKYFCSKYKNIYIYGAGEIAMEISKIMTYEHCEYKAFLVSQYNSEGKQLLRHDVVTLDMLENLGKNEIGIILSVNKKNHGEILSKIKKAGYHHYINAGKYSLKYD